MSNSGIVKHVPNLLTSLTIIFGSLAIILAMEGEKSLILASYAVFIAAIIDIIDGAVARKLKATSDVGKQFDLFADLICFGMAPTAIMYELIQLAAKIKQPFIKLPYVEMFILASAFLFVIFTALRLAKFNVERDRFTFIGLPSPAAAITVASIPLIKSMIPEDFLWYRLLHWLIDYDFPITATIFLIGIQIFVFEQIYVLLPLCIFLSVILIAEVPMISLRFENYSYKENKGKYWFLSFSLLMLIIFQSLAIPFIIFTYIGLSILYLAITSLANKRTKKNFDRIFLSKKVNA